MTSLSTPIPAFSVDPRKKYACLEAFQTLPLTQIPPICRHLQEMIQNYQNTQSIKGSPGSYISEEESEKLFAVFHQALITRALSTLEKHTTPSRWQPVKETLQNIPPSDFGPRLEEALALVDLSTKTYEPESFIKHLKALGKANSPILNSPVIEPYLTNRYMIEGLIRRCPNTSKDLKKFILETFQKHHLTSKTLKTDKTFLDLQRFSKTERKTPLLNYLQNLLICSPENKEVFEFYYRLQRPLSMLRMLLPNENLCYESIDTLSTQIEQLSYRMLISYVEEIRKDQPLDPIVEQIHVLFTRKDLSLEESLDQIKAVLETSGRFPVLSLLLSDVFFLASCLKTCSYQEALEVWKHFDKGSIITSVQSKIFKHPQGPASTIKAFYFDFFSELGHIVNKPMTASFQDLKTLLSLTQDYYYEYIGQAKEEVKRNKLPSIYNDLLDQILENKNIPCLFWICDMIAYDSYCAYIAKLPETHILKVLLAKNGPSWELMHFDASEKLQKLRQSIADLPIEEPEKEIYLSRLEQAKQSMYEKTKDLFPIPPDQEILHKVYKNCFSKTKCFKKIKDSLAKEIRYTENLDELRDFLREKGFFDPENGSLHLYRAQCLEVYKYQFRQLEQLRQTFANQSLPILEQFSSIAFSPILRAEASKILKKEDVSSLEKVKLLKVLVTPLEKENRHITEFIEMLNEILTIGNSEPHAIPPQYVFQDYDNPTSPMRIFCEKSTNDQLTYQNLLSDQYFLDTFTFLQYIVHVFFVDKAASYHLNILPDLSRSTSPSLKDFDDILYKITWAQLYDAVKRESISYQAPRLFDKLTTIETSSISQEKKLERARSEICSSSLPKDIQKDLCFLSKPESILNKAKEKLENTANWLSCAASLYKIPQIQTELDKANSTYSLWASIKKSLYHFISHIENKSKEKGFHPYYAQELEQMIIQLDFESVDTLLLEIERFILPEDVDLSKLRFDDL